MNAKVKPGYKQTEVGVIPEDWDVKTVAEIKSPIRNAIVGGPFGSDLVSNDYVEVGVPVIRGQNMGRKFVVGDFVFVSEEKARGLSANTATMDDLVFTQRGTMGQVSLVPQDSYNRYLISQSQMKMTIDRGQATPLFLYYYFTSSKIQRVISDSTIQTGVPHINLGILKSYFVALPGLPEQRAIATALGDADALIESLEQLVAKKRRIKQGTMQELLTGKNRLPGFGGKWMDTLLSDACWFQEGPGVRNYQFTSSGVKLFNGTNIEKNRIELDKTDRFISEREAYGGYSHFLADEGDIVIACSGITVEKFDEKVAVLEAHHLPLCMNTSTMRFKVRPQKMIDGYLQQLLCSSLFKKQIGGSATGSAQLNFGPSHVSKVAFELPDTTEQTAIAAILSDMDAEISALEAKLAKARQVKQGMMQELLTGKTRLI